MNYSNLGPWELNGIRTWSISLGRIGILIFAQMNLGIWNLPQSRFRRFKVDLGLWTLIDIFTFYGQYQLDEIELEIYKIVDGSFYWQQSVIQHAVETVLSNLKAARTIGKLKPWLEQVHWPGALACASVTGDEPICDWFIHKIIELS